jgi:UvrD-like helicase C-terminal domain/AAA domain
LLFEELSVVVSAPEKKARWSKKSALAAEPQWSGYQNAVFDWLENSNGNLRIGAVAGSGKSTLLSAIVTRLPVDSRASILAFNKHISEAMKLKVPSRVGVFTAHGYGYGMLARCFEGAPVVESDKYRRIAKRLVDGLDVSTFTQRQMLIGNQSESVARGIVIRGLVKDLCLLVSGVQSTLCQGDRLSLLEMIEFYGLAPVIDFGVVMGLVGSALDDGDRIAREQQVIDYSDMLWLVHRWDLQSAKKDYVLCDEVQDANNAQLSLYKRIGQDSRVILVGDEKQSIQGFAFAAPDMWGKIQEEFNTHALPLSVCYRCPSSHLDLARYFVPEIQARDNAIAGTIATIHPNAIKGMVQDGDLILCRFTAPLVEMCLRLILNGTSAKVRGKDIGAQITGLIDQVCPSSSDWACFAENLRIFVSAQTEKLRAAMKDEQADALKDKADCLMACYDAFGGECYGAAQFSKRISDLFSDGEAKVILSTIHRAKGDEADRVFILKSNALPYVPKSALDWQIQQEENLAYVAITRSKCDLFFAPIGKDDDETNGLVNQPYGGMDVAPVKHDEWASPVVKSKTVPVPQSQDFTDQRTEEKKQDEVNRIHERFKAFENGAIIRDPQTAVEATETLYQVPPVPQRALDVGVMVAMFHNPRCAGRIVAINGAMLSVVRGGEVVEIEAARCKALIPVGMEFVVYEDVVNEPD